MHSATATPDNSADSGTDFTGWLLRDAQMEWDASNANRYELTLIETAPPRAAGPLGDWRVVRCDYPAIAEGEALACRLWVAREQLPQKAA